MDRCGLSVTDFNTYVTHLRSASVTVNTHAQLLAMDGTVLNTVGQYDSRVQITGGQLNVDTTQAGQPSRQATLILSDPGHSMSWGSNSFEGSGASVDRMIRVQHVTWVPGLNKRVVCDLITGPINSWNRSGDNVTMSIVGRDAVMQGQAWFTKTYRKGQLKTDVIADLFQTYGGSATPGIPTLAARLPANLSMARATVPWNQVKTLANSLNRQVFYNSGGRPALRVHPAVPVMTLWEGDSPGHNSDLLQPTQITGGLTTGWYNVALVTGNTSKIQAYALPPVSDALHPANMNSGDAWRVQLHEETNTNIRSVAEAKARAQQLINQQIQQQAQVTFTSKVFPFLEEGDLLRVVTDNGPLSHRLQKWSVDFAGTGMSVGWNKMFTPNHARPSRRLAR